LAREKQGRPSGGEAASLKIKTSFAERGGKRHVRRYFSTLQLSAHFISVIARTRIDHATSPKSSSMREQRQSCEALKPGIPAPSAVRGARDHEPGHL